MYPRRITTALKSVVLHSHYGYVSTGSLFKQFKAYCVLHTVKAKNTEKKLGTEKLSGFRYN